MIFFLPLTTTPKSLHKLHIPSECCGKRRILVLVKHIQHIEFSNDIYMSILFDGCSQGPMPSPFAVASCIPMFGQCASFFQDNSYCHGVARQNKNIGNCYTRRPV